MENARDNDLNDYLGSPSNPLEMLTFLRFLRLRF